MTQRFLDQCRTLLGASFVLTDAADIAMHLMDHRQRFAGNGLAVLKPADTAEVAAIVRLCAEFRIPIVPQGGNTGLVLGSVPDQSGSAIVLSLVRLNHIRGIDVINNTMTVEAGCLLQNVQEAANQANRLFPLSLASEGSCTIGGNLSTNAGGTAVLHYGTTRALCLGLEVVTAQGDIWHGLRGLRKDNTGYDLRDLYIGSEGTLGVITAAVLTLFPKPVSQLTAFAAVASIDHALTLLTLARSASNNAELTGFELMSAFSLELVERHFPSSTMPLRHSNSASAPYFVLIEFSSQETIADSATALENWMATALEQGVIQDAVVATSIAQTQTLWHLRESISPAQAAEGKNIKHDISIPISVIGTFIAHTDHALQRHFPGCRMVTFGHVGDGNLHYNVSPPQDQPSDAFLAQQSAINRVVYDSVSQFNGSISAEHGLGALKIDEITHYKSVIELNLMRTIKTALDPLNIMNPGKVIRAS